ncbi:LPXTG cell wall anchor domain-containing protein [Actinoplanes sp. NPDC048796]|uniref:LPXTG cell wall anchor domain-containing protein n=1 Tax=unclassified Actinoplanes TaxID=2626549 RepID=UPI0033EC84F8
MSSLRRIVAVGLPTAGLTVAAALALGGSPAVATADQAAQPRVAITTTDPGRPGGAAGYGTEAPDTDTPTRGNPGYGSPAPTTPAPSSATPSTPATTTPTANTDTVPAETPAGAAPATTAPGGGVSAGGALPVTGAPMSTLVALGGLLVAAGAASVWYTRRRRSA